MRRACALLAGLSTLAACWGAPTGERPGSPLAVTIEATDDAGGRIVRVTGWSSDELASLSRAPLTTADWSALIALRVAGGEPVAVAATYTVTDTGVDLVPVYPLDPGRTYLVQVDATRLPVPRQAPTLIKKFTLPAADARPPTRVVSISPSATTWPENTLRFYLHFSSAMSGTSAVGHVRLVDAANVDIPDVLLDVDVDLWNTDYTRRTVFFDPGRVKRDIRPNRELGRALVAGRRYAIVVSTMWKDAAGQPLAEEFRHTFTAGAPVEQPIDPKAWTIGAVRRGTQEPLVVRFPWALDEGLLQRAVGVTRADGQAIDGTITIADYERQWSFTPSAPWPSGPLSLTVLTLLEDPAGNRVGEAFEFEMFGKPTKDVERVTLPILVK